MPEIPELFTSWTFWYLVGAALVVVAAALLITILLVARSIEKEAARALEAARRIQARTAAIRALTAALDSVLDLHRRAEAIADKAEMLAGRLHGEPGAAPREEWQA